MNDLTLVRKNLFRKKLRAWLMIISILVAFLISLRDLGYVAAGKKNIVAFEVRPHGVHEKDTSEGVIANAKQTLEKAWAAL